ncbi:MAG: hypothetical protein AAF456_10365 [Planctomycetota bacterium]
MINTTFCRCVFSAALALTLLCTSSFADPVVIYDNNAGGPTGLNNGYQSDPHSGQIQADEFELQVESIIGRIEWTGLYAGNDSPQDDSFTIHIFEDAGGSPLGGTPVASFSPGNNVNRTDSGTNFAGLDVYEYSVDLMFVADPDTSYWLSIINDTTNDPNDNWYWGTNTSFGNNHRSFNNGATWQQIGARTDFRLLSIPEPASGLVVSVASALALIRRRR